MPQLSKSMAAMILASALAGAGAGVSAQEATDGGQETAPAVDADAPAEAEATTNETTEATTADTADDVEGGAAGTGEAAMPEAPLGLAMGEEQAEVGQTYIQEEHGDWDVRCVRTETGNDPCQLYQLLEDGEGNNVAEISIFPLPEPEGEAVAGATIITPLETLLTAQVGLRVDEGAVRRYPFSWCSAIGCFSRVGFTAEDIVSFRRGREAQLAIRPVAAPDQTVALSVSLTGFTAGYEAVASANAE
jgi:invasion protein IalB